MSHFAESGVTIFTFNKGGDCLFMMSCNHCIAFLVTNLRPPFNMSWSSANGSAINDFSGTISRARIALFKLLLAERFSEHATVTVGCFLRINVAINSLLANSNLISDLLRTSFVR